MNPDEIFLTWSPLPDKIIWLGSVRPIEIPYCLNSPKLEGQIDCERWIKIRIEPQKIRYTGFGVVARGWEPRTKTLVCCGDFVGSQPDYPAWYNEIHFPRRV